MLSPDKHDRVVELVAVERIRGCDTFPPAHAKICLDFKKKDFFDVLGEERSAKRAHQRERAMVDGDSFDPHEQVIAEESYESRDL